MRSIRFLAVAVLAVVLALSAVQNVFASTLLFHDDGVPESLTAGDGVVFSLPSGWSSAHVLILRYWIDYVDPNGPRTFKANIWGSDGTTQLLVPMITVGPLPLAFVGWYDVDVSSKNIIVSGDFYVGFTGNTPNPVLVGADTEDRAPDSYSGGPVGYTGPSWTSWGNVFHLLIRVEVDQPAPPTGPVGGFVEPVNKLAVLAPWLAVIGLVSCVSAMVAGKRRS
jgi:hypothetical protein